MFTFFLKEIRQLRRDMVFWGTLIVQLVLCALIIALGKLSKGDFEGKYFSHGYDTLGVMAGMIVAIAMSMRWHGDMNDDALNPVVTTPLPPVRIAAGKYLATWIAVLIPLAVAYIFITATVPGDLFDPYLEFRLPMNAAILVTSSAFLLTVSPARIKSGFVCSVLPGIFLLFILTSVWLPRSFMMMALKYSWNTCPAMICTMVRILLPIPLLFALTVAAISAPSSDRAIPVRITLLATLAAYLLVYWLENRNLAGWSSHKLAHHAAWLCRTGAMLSCLAAVAERGAQSSRVVAAIRRTPAALRPLRILCSTGAITELIFSVALAAAGVILENAAKEFSSGAMHPEIAYMHLLFCASFALALSSIVHMAFRRRIAPVLRYLIMYAVNIPLGFVVVADLIKDHRVYLVILGIVSAGLLIPTAWEFIASLKRR